MKAANCCAMSPEETCSKLAEGSELASNRGQSIRRKDVPSYTHGPEGTDGTFYTTGIFLEISLVVKKSDPISFFLKL